MNPVRAAILLTSQNGNCYVFDKNQKKVTLLHPAFYRLIEMNQQGEDLEKWVGKLDSESVEIEGLGPVSTEEIRYYYKKFLLFKDNGYFSQRDLETSKNASFAARDIETRIANVTQIVFEVTERCNLKCDYCAYGRFYNRCGVRKNVDMDTTLAKRALDFLLSKIKTSLNDSHRQNLVLGFYGGEPLLNFPLIREIVEYMGHIDLPGVSVSYGITTNGLFLEKYMDFLVRHEFDILISLDGDEKSNGYRVLKSGAPGFSEILRNVKALQSRYPEFFETNVQFNSVLHGKNTISGIEDFFKKEFSKVPTISTISPLGIRPEAKDEFRQKYNAVMEDLKNCSQSSRLENEIKLQLPQLQSLFHFLRQESFFIYNTLNHLLVEENNWSEFPTGTCQPFGKKVFITVDGKILPCERIGYSHELGRVGPDAVHLDNETVARCYNRWFEKAKQQCISCYSADNCSVCIYYFKDFPDLKVCTSHTGYSQFSKIVSQHLDLLETEPEMYLKIMTNES